MKFTNAAQVDEFLEVIRKCKGQVFLTSPYGDRYNLNSKFSAYIAVGAMLGENGDELELFCENKEDRVLLLNYLEERKD